MTHHDTVTTRPGGPLRGSLRPPGDKSISHRAFLLATLAEGTTVIRDALESGDCAHSRAAAEALGCVVSHEGDATLVRSPGRAALTEPAGVIDCGRSGTTMRLLCGLLAGRPFPSFLVADPQLAKRPMGRVLEPLSRLGLRSVARAQGTRAPIAIVGGPLTGRRVVMPVASAQVKSALLLAGLDAEGTTEVVEPGPARDHTERMLAAQGAPLEQGPGPDGAWLRVRRPDAPLRPLEIRVPADPSSAAFLIVAATLVPGSEVTLLGVGTNPTRDGLVQVLRRMGAHIEERAPRMEGGEPVADLHIRAARLRGVEVGGGDGPAVVTLIDELPVLALAACLAEGQTVVRDAGELRVKETDRIAVTTVALSAIGGDIASTPDGWIIQGRASLSGGEADSGGDHRIAMALMVAGLVAERGVRTLDAGCASDSYPGFIAHLRALGAAVEEGAPC